MADSDKLLPPPPPKDSPRLAPKCGPGLAQFSDGSCGCPEGMIWKDPGTTQTTPCIFPSYEMAKAASGPAAPLVSGDQLTQMAKIGGGVILALLLLGILFRRK